MNNTKITVKVWEQQLAVFDKAIDELFIKRDAFLNHMIKVETPHLAKDLEGHRLSSSGNRYIARELKRLGTKPVNIVVEKATANALKEVVNATNTVRDAFVNRLIMLLRAPEALLKFWELPLSVGASDAVDSPSTSPLNAIRDVYRDPLCYLRDAAEARHKVGLYTAWLPSKFVGLECFIEDDRVPGTVQYETKEKEMRELMEALASVESAAFQTPRVQAGGKK